MNTQRPQRSTEATIDGNLDVHSIFYTVQGEGPFAGRPAVFIRLAGCNIQCPHCDTEYTRERPNLCTPQELLECVRQLLKNTSRAVLGKVDDFSPVLVVITGGEPLRQGNLFLLVSVLDDAGFMVQIETNGTIPLPVGLAESAVIVCSPKSSHVDASLVENAHFKFVVSSGNTDDDGLPTNVLGRATDFRNLRRELTFERIYIQPMDAGDTEQNRLNTAHAVAVCMRHGYNLCLQLHKFANLP